MSPSPPRVPGGRAAGLASASPPRLPSRAWSRLVHAPAASVVACVVASVVAFLVTALLPSEAHAQGGDKGSIIGYVYDAAGMPLKGVKVTAASPTQIGGSKSAYSNDEGFFRIPALIPGVFEVRAMAAGMSPVIQRGLKVGISSATEVNLVLEVQTKTEEVKVVEKTPAVSTTTSNVKEVFDLDFVDALPHESRDGVFSAMVNSTAGAIRGGRMRGGASNQTIVSMDGFNMQGQYPSLKASAAYEIQSAGYGAEHAMAPGGVVNLVTKSGSNAFEFEVGGYMEERALEFFRDSTDARTGQYYYVLNPTVAGPLIKDRLWFYVNLEGHLQRTGRDRDPEGILPDPAPLDKAIGKGTLKLTWQVTPRNKLQSITNFDEVYEVNRRSALGVEAIAQENRRGQRYFTGLIWESLLTDSLLFRSQAGVITVPQHIYPASCEKEPDTCDHVPQTVQKFPRRVETGNGPLHERNDLQTLQIVHRLDWFLDAKSFGQHGLHFKHDFNVERDVRRTSHPGNALIEFNGPPEQRTEYFSNDPRLEDARRGWFIASSVARRNQISLSDEWRATRGLTLTPSVAWVHASAENSTGQTAVRQWAFVPSFSAAWDATGDGRTVLRGSASRYVDVDVNAIARHTLGSEVSLRCKWNPETQAYDRECQYSGGRTGNTFGSPCSPTGRTPTGQPCRESLVIPRTYEYTLGAEREVVQGLALGLDVVSRKFENQYEKRETNRIWIDSGDVLDPVGSYRNGRAESVIDLSTPDQAWRRYFGVTAGLTKREGRLRLRASYTWSRLWGTVFNGNDNQWGDIPGRDVFLDGPLPDDHRHEVKFTSTYQAARWLSFGVRQSFYTGLPYSRLYRNPETGRFESYRAQRGIDPRDNVNDPADDRPLRTPDNLSLNAQVRVNFAPLIGTRLEAYVDVLNVLALRTPTEIGQEDGRDFGATRSRMGPFRLRLGMQYRY